MVEPGPSASTLLPLVPPGDVSAGSSPDPGEDGGALVAVHRASELPSPEERLLDLLPPTVSPLCWYEHEQVLMPDGRARLRDRWWWGCREDYWHRPVGVVTVDEYQYFQVRVRLPVWLCCQVECLKRCWCETILRRTGIWPKTYQFHLELSSAPHETTNDCGRPWRPLPLCTYLRLVSGPGPRPSGCRFRVVYHEEPTFHVVTVDLPGWRPALLCAALAEPLRL